MMTQAKHYERFLALHQQPEAFVMPNPWDGLSALIFKKAGFAARATSSAALAATLGRHDGRHAVSVDEHLAHAKLLIEVGGLPVNGDFEDGYGTTPEDVTATVNRDRSRVGRHRRRGHLRRSRQPNPTLR
jgi:2-methylisocitrate lyase-like PEP mutase family enzyme